MISRIYLIILSFSLLVLQGCVAVQPFPTVARAGDTVTLAVGSAEGMVKSSTNVFFTPDGGSEVAIPNENIRAIIRLYPDKRTNAWSASSAIAIDTLTGHGSWLSVMVVDLPSTLPVGTGTVRVSTPATYAAFSNDINDETIAIEILPGVGAPATFDYQSVGASVAGDLSNIELMPHYLIKPDFVIKNFWEPVPWPTFGAIELKIVGTVSGIPEDTVDSNMRVVLDEMEENFHSHLQMDWQRNGDTTTINLISPTGLLQYYEARASIFFTNLDAQYSAIPTVTARYFDTSGQVIPGPVLKVTYSVN
jgi:hypothetical protein